MLRSMALVLALLMIVVAGGCRRSTTSTPTTSGGSADTGDAETTNQLRSFGQAFESFHLKNKRGPNDWDEAMGMGASVAALKEKGCLVAWGIRYRDATVGANQFVLAYPPSTMESGGPVLLLDGSVLQAKPEPLAKLLEAQAEIGVPR
ncbi:MAG: hypothetical protein AAGI63_07645 [Planctomycetota bacterium]